MWIYIVIGLCVAVVLIICFCLSVASFAFDNYRDKHHEIDQFNNSCELTTLQYVSEINSKHFNGKINIVQCPEYQDHYSVGTIALSQSTMNSNSLASFSIISHEIGHALQDKDGVSLRKHWKNRRSGRLIGKFFLPLVIIGAILCILNLTSVLSQSYVLYIGISLFGVALLIFVFALYLRYREIKIEKEASNFAIQLLSEYLTKPELELCEDFLKAARLTYWANLFKTMFAWTMLTNKSEMFK